MSDPEAPADLEKRVREIEQNLSYQLAEADPEFLDSDAARPARLALEAMRPETALRAHEVHATVVVFGSARISSPAEARILLEQAEVALRARPDDAKLQRALAGARSRLAWSAYYEEARTLGRELGEICGTSCERLVIVTGGGPGIMAAANRGAGEAGRPSVGLNIDLPREQRPNPWITPGLAFRFRYFALRKLHFLLRAKALVTFPGGYGTLDELFEALTLVQTGKIKPIPIILVGSRYWQRLIDFEFLVDEGFITLQERRLFQVVETGREAAEAIRDFYSSSVGS